MKTLLVGILGLAGLSPAAALADGPVDYLRDVKPILAKHCVSCHGPAKPRAKLRLDTAANARKGGSGGPAVVAGDAEASPLIDAVGDEAGADRMPLNRPPLSVEEIATLRAWIDQGANAPADEVADPNPPPHWAFIPPSRPRVPEVKDRAWPRNAIDHFILARLEREGLRPSPEADRATLIRRVSLDLIGLPPSPDELEAFLADDRPDAFERVVDRLLASPHFGERWARPWLDLARYADSNGYSIDAPRSIWKYRDWVIDAFNRDLPFDEFTIDQLAGDLRPDASMEQRIATGFHRNTPINQEGGIDLEQFRIESVIDRVHTTATTFLGLTLGCAQCHDHKYDPISQKDYYRFFAFFNNCDEPDLPIATPEELARNEQVQAEIDAYLKGVREKDPATVKAQADWEAGLSMVDRQKQSQEVRAAFDVVASKRSEAQRKVTFAAFVDQSPTTRTHRDVINKMKAKVRPIATTMAVRERAEPRETHLLIQGDFTRPGEIVSPGVPTALPPLRTASASSSSASAPNRMDLARWLVDPGNPLTSRVTVNRLWQEHFGRGLVETEGDFGTQGAPPSHPELLDWLALELIDRGWSRKQIHRLIVTSATYRQSSRVRPELSEIDRENRLLARQSRLRLDAELVRDAALTASGLLSTQVGGPSVFPPQPEGVMTLGQMRREWVASVGPDRYRRGLYTYFWRATPHPLLMVFDAPDATRSCTRRPRSNTPLQALTLLNDEAFLEFAQALADRILAEGPADDRARIDLAFRLCVSRPPAEKERRRLQQLLDRLRDEEGVRAKEPREEMPDGRDAFLGAEDRTAWTTAARVLLNLDEFITRE